MNLPQGQRGRILALVILLLVLFLLFQWLIQPLWARYSALSEEVADASFSLQRYQNIAAQLPALRDNYQNLQAEQPLAPLLLEGRNRSLAAAELQRHLQDRASHHGGRILSARALQHQTEGPFEAIALDARLQIEVRGLLELLYDLENTLPYTRIENINAAARQVRRQDPGMIDVRLTISGLRTPSTEDDSRG